jgi:hypothetical protein
MASKTAPSKSTWARFRVQTYERDALKCKADAAGKTVSELIRESFRRVKTWTLVDKATEHAKIREI